jgi:hypothetical protein
MAVFQNVKVASPVTSAVPPNLTSVTHSRTASPYPAPSTVEHGPALQAERAPFWQLAQQHGSQGPHIWSLGRMIGSGFGHQH